jgi:hypothetical protein
MGVAGRADHRRSGTRCVRRTGQPLTHEVIEACAAEVPAEHRAAVVETLRRVTF